MDMVLYALLNKKIKGVASGVASHLVVGTDLILTFNDGSSATISFDQPKDGVSVDRLEFKEDTNELWYYMTNGTSASAGTIPVGKEGLSAYEVAKKNGFSGTEEEWLESLQATGGKIDIIRVNGEEITINPDDKSVNIAIPDAPIQSISQAGIPLKIDEIGNVDIPVAGTNKIEIIKVNGVEQAIDKTDKSVNIDLQEYAKTEEVEGYVDEQLYTTTTVEAHYAVVAAETPGALEVVADNVTAAEGQINLSNVAPVLEGVNITAGDYVVYVDAVTTKEPKFLVEADLELNVTDKAVDGEYIAAVNQTNGKVSVVREKLPDYTGFYDAKGAADKALEEAKTYTDTGISSTLESAKSYTDTKIDAIVGEGAAETLDTIGEISTAIKDNQDMLNTLNLAIGNKANFSDLEAHIKDKLNPHSVTKEQIGLGNVENKNSATIREELTNENVINALGYTPSQTDTKYIIVTSSTDGLVPKFDAADGTIDNSSADWVFTNKSGSIGWYKLPENAFKNTIYTEATSSINGLMSSEDKVKLDTITEDADAVAFTQTLTSGTEVGVISINGINTTLYAPSDTHNTTGITAGESGTVANAATTDPYIKIKDNNTHRSQVQLKGAGSITIASDANGVITITGENNNTDTKVTNTLAKATKAYVTGTTSATTNTGTQVFDTDVYLDSAAGTLVATTFKGALEGNASTATTATNTKTTAVAPATSATYYPTFVDTNNSTATAEALKTNASINYQILIGTASVQGRALMQVGNNTAVGTAGNCAGYIRIYGTTAHFTQLKGGTPAEDVTVIVPSTSGTLALTSSTVARADHQGATAASDPNTSLLRQIASGTAAATTSNCPAGSLYGTYS